MDSKEKDNWISVETRMPEKEGAYIVHAEWEHEGQKGYGFDIVQWQKGEFVELISEEFKTLGVTHWQPLPSPPKQK